jgi:mono/diheme cytochrome c family protein
MKIMDHLPFVFVMVIVVAGAGIAISQFFSLSGGSAARTVKVPALSPLALSGKQAFDKNCAQCHGANGAGSDKGPPLVHDIYNPGHHGDGAFVSATRNGTRAHHWNFGDMKPLPKVTDKEIAAIIRYVRELQRANGIFYRKHTM